jgi:MoxR-like ATPase
MSAFEYNKEAFFNPPATVRPLKREEGLRGGDRATGSPYEFDEEIILAVNVAWAANRPLLVAGSPGTGKSTLADGIAATLNLKPPLVEVITARTEARDLKWRFDAVRRLRDAQRGQDLPDRSYVKPGVLWQAFEASSHRQRVVVLIDEIDKADPDVPNGLLAALGAGTFDVDELADAEGNPYTIKADKETPPFIVVTTNDERELPSAFLRRCIALTLRAPSNERLLDIAKAWGLAGGADYQKAKMLADKIAGAKGETLLPGARPPRAAEYLDALRTCLNLKLELEGAAWDAVAQLTLYKRLNFIQDDA